jgi:hypothetical protein
LLWACDVWDSALIHHCRNILGEDLGPLSMKELEQLENQIEISLKHIRTRKVGNFTSIHLYISIHFSACLWWELICLQNQMLLNQLFDLKSKVIMIWFDFLLSNFISFHSIHIKLCDREVTIMFCRSKNYRTLTRTSGKR